MKAYAIFDGGGVKAAALAGCLAAAEREKIEFVGYGGTSAGAIIATLASVGYTGAEVRELLLTTFHPASMLEDGGEQLKLARGAWEECAEILASKRCLPSKLRVLWRLRKQCRPLYQRVLRDLGLYTGESLRKNLTDLIYAKVERLRGKELTFEALEAEGCKPLKIVASDLNHRCAVIFGHPREGLAVQGLTVVDAVRASAGYPLVFQPYHRAGETVLVDGGLASNLPSFLFHRERELTRFPIVSFDLAPPQPVPTTGIQAFLVAMFDTALEASDHLPSSANSDVFQIPVTTPENIGTLKFDLTPEEIRTLYNEGYTQASERLGKWPRLQWARQRVSDLQKELRAFYGDQRIYEGPLWALAAEIEEYTGAENVRTSIMLPTGNEKNTRIVVYHYGFEGIDIDDKLELNEYGGCSGQALQTRKPTFVDLDEIKADPDAWDLTMDQQKLVCIRQRSMFSVPIFAWDNSDRSLSDYPIIGTLSFDSSTPLDDTSWVTARADGTKVPSAEVVVRAQAWSDIISLLLRARI